MEKIKSYMVLPNGRKEEAIDCAEKLKKELLGKHSVVIEPSLDSTGKFLNNADIFIIAGGDGTMLSTVNSSSLEGLFLGLNFGDTGFMMNDVVPVEDVVERILQGKFDVISFPLLEITSNGETAFAINDFFFKANGPQACKFYVKINGELISEESFIADGGIICTPLGSTGYNLSAGGSRISHNAQSMGLTFICSHRPLRFPSQTLSFDDEVEIEILYFDEGRVGVHKDNSSLTEFGPKIKIKMSDKTANLAFWKNTDFMRRLDKILAPSK